MTKKTQQAISVAGAAALMAGTAISAPRMDAPNAEIRQVINEVSSAFHAFKAANDERIGLLEKGRDDYVKNEEVDRINDAVGDAKALLDTLQAQVRDLETLAARPSFGGGESAERAERQFAAQFFTQCTRKYVNPLQDDLDVEKYRAYADAFPALLRSNGFTDQLPNEVRAALQVGSDTAGGYLVPPEVSSVIMTKLYDTSPMRQVAGNIQIGTDAWEQPKDVNDATSGGWVGEQASRTATDTPEIGEQRIPVHEQYAYPEITQKMLDDAMIDIEAWLQNKTIDKMERTENTAFVTGNGVARPRGFADYGSASVTTDDASRAWGVLQYVASGAAGAFPAYSGTAADDAGALIDAITKLKQQYRMGAVWAMNRNTEGTIRKLRDADGRYLVEFGNLERGVGFTLHGHDIVNFEDMADIAANSYSVAFGNFGVGYLIVDRIGIRVLRDPFTNKPKVGLYVTKRVGGDVVNSDAIKLVKFAAS